ncbi:MAG: cytochrome c oxidase subunit 3 [Rickettsiales bacterium]|nr:cytochrome c oxidase subunit 3 [Rickettsiales bacterium]|tara:strand:- start:1916 stop:2746 length:831 start_codon:yes stop_codon:yes gene_type:complete
MANKPEYGTTGKPHPYHLVNPSPWPFLASIAAGITAAGAVMFMHDVEFMGFPVGLKGLILGFVSLVLIAIFWWKDVIFEAVTEKAHTAVAKIGMRYGMALFIASEVMFFVAFFWAFFHSSLSPTEAIGSVWPPVGVETFDPLDLPFLMTMLLLLSGCTVTWAHHEMVEGNMDKAAKATGLTVLIAVIFLGFQMYEYGHAAFGFSDNVFGATFYMATGFHGFHVLVGAIFLAVCYFRTKKGHFTKESHFGFEAAAWYWHFVDVVWLFLFVAVYWWGG